VVMCDLTGSDAVESMVVRCNRATVRNLRIEPMRSCPRELHTRNVSSVKGTEDGSCIAALDYKGDVSIFAIENGSICLVRPFSHQSRRTTCHVYLFGFRGNIDFLPEDWTWSGGAIDVVDGKNGNRVRSLRYSR
jgi:hypothetical protein